MVSLDAGGTATPRARAVPPMAFVARGGPSPERAALDDELSGRSPRLVRALPPKLRDPLLLIGSGDYSYDEVAAMLGIPVGTVKWRVSEARRQLRAKLTGPGILSRDRKRLALPRFLTLRSTPYCRR